MAARSSQAPFPTRGAPSTYLRIVATRRCPLACNYCHREAEGRDDVTDLPPALIGGVVSAGLQAVRLGKVKLTGGDPLARPDLAEVVSVIAKAAPDSDLSVVTPGILPAKRAAEARTAGLARANLSVHGFTRDAFAARGNPARRHAAWRSHFELWRASGRTPKLNYVYGGPDFHADLAALLEFARERRALVRLLDDLSGPPVSVEELRCALLGLRGAPSRRNTHAAPHALPTERLEWADGLTVELKATRLGKLAPLSACPACPHRSSCREGIHAWRLTADGHLKPCALRDDLAIPIVSVLQREGHEATVEAWSELARRLQP